MTIQTLIDKLMKIEDKSRTIQLETEEDHGTLEEVISNRDLSFITLTTGR